MNELFNIRRRGLTWLGKLKLRAAAYVIGVPLAVFAVMSIGPAWMTLPLVGVAVAAVTVSLNKLGQRLESRTCWTCGTDLSSEPTGEHGVACRACGTLHQPTLALAAADDPDPRLDDTDDSARA